MSITSLNTAKVSMGLVLVRLERAISAEGGGQEHLQIFADPKREGMIEMIARLLVKGTSESANCLSVSVPPKDWDEDDDDYEGDDSYSPYASAGRTHLNSQGF